MTGIYESKGVSATVIISTSVSLGGWGVHDAEIEVEEVTVEPSNSPLRTEILKLHRQGRLSDSLDPV